MRLGTNVSDKCYAAGRKARRLARSRDLFSLSWFDEKILASDRLTVLPVLDLYPGRRFRRVPGACLLRHNALHVPLADNTEQVRAAREVLHVDKRSRLARQQLPQERLPFRVGPLPQVAPIQPQ